MKKILTRMFDFFLGINWSFGFVLAVWTFIGLFFPISPLTQVTLCFLFLSVSIPWVINFIFSYTSYLYVKGILHGVVWFVLEVILYNLFFPTPPGAKTLLLCAGIFAVVYALVLWLFSHLASKLNTPVRHTSEFLAKLSNMLGS